MLSIEQNTKKPLLIIGCGGHAKVITDIAREIGFTKIFYNDSNKKKDLFLGCPVVNEDIKNYSDYFIVAIGDNFIREKVTFNFLQSNPNSMPAILVHPTSIISENCTLGAGSTVMPLCVINSHSKIGKGVIVNTRSSLDHDNYLMDFSSVAPGVTTGGNVYIGHRSVISIGSVIKNGLIIGSDTVIGASSYVNIDIASNFVAYGSPAKIIREREVGEKYL
tara:strand:+ start:923 stop:1582 length:660 start_codon:yes stop_codon:yes gene_type:complete